MSLVEEMRQIERVVSDATDMELSLLIGAAIEDMRRMGIREELLDEDDMDPLARMAVAFYVKASYGHDDSEHDKWWQRYTWTTTSMLNSSKNECAS